MPLRDAPEVTAEKLGEAKRELVEALGSEWVSDHPAVLTCYHRDFTNVTGKKPQIVALPSSTEEVRAVMRIVRKHRLPLVTMTTGFNHAGLCIPKRGGVLIDLRRMEDVLEIDEESMTLTISPYVRIGAIYEECNKRFSTDGVRLRPSIPLTMPSVSLLSNYISGGMTHMSYKTGNHHENIVSSTWVLPDGEILKTGPPTLEGFPDKVAVLGPGPDMLGMFLASEASFGICTELTIKLYNEAPVEKVYFLAYEEEEENDLDIMCEFYKAVAGENFVQDMYKSGNRHAGQVLTEYVEDILEVIPVHILFLTLTGLDSEELEIKEKRLKEIVEGVEGIDFLHPASIDLFYRAMEIDEEEFNRVMFKRVYKGSRAQRWKGCFNFIAYAVKFEKIPELERLHRRLVKKYFAPADPEVSFNTIPFGVSLQGPMQMGRMCALEFDYYTDPGNPDEVKRLSLMLNKVGEEFAGRGVMCGRGPGQHEYQLKYMDSFMDLLRRTKKMMDPDLVLSPGNFPLWED